MNLTVRQSANPGAATSSAGLAAELNGDLDDMAADSTMSDLVEGGRWEAVEMAGHAVAVRDAGEGGWTTAVRKDGQAAVESSSTPPRGRRGSRWRRPLWTD